MVAKHFQLIWVYEANLSTCVDNKSYLCCSSRKASQNPAPWIHTHHSEWSYKVTLVQILAVSLIWSSGKLFSTVLDLPVFKQVKYKSNRNTTLLVLVGKAERVEFPSAVIKLLQICPKLPLKEQWGGESTQLELFHSLPLHWSLAT